MSDERKDRDLIDEQIERVQRAMKGALSIREGATRLGITPLMAAVLCSVGGDKDTREAAGFLLSEEVYKFGEKVMRTPFDLRKRVTESQDSTPTESQDSEVQCGKCGAKNLPLSEWGKDHKCPTCPHGFTILAHGTCDCPECP